MKKILFIFTILIYLVGCDQLNKDRFVLNGEIECDGAQYVILSYRQFPEGKYVVDTAVIANGVFSITDTLYEPVLAKLQLQDTILSFYLEPGKAMTLNFSRYNSSEVVLQNSQTDIENSELQKELREYLKLLNKERYQLMKVCERLEILQDSNTLAYRKLIHEERQHSLAIESLNDRIQSISEEFINTHPRSFVSAFVLDKYIFEGRIELAKQKKMYESFSDSIRESYIGKEISEKIQCQENTSAGGTAPDFTTIDIDGNPFSLSSFKGESYVMLDFWASWCEFCYKNIPTLKKAYSRYHEKGFEIISISNEDSENDWKSAIDKNDLGDWHHVINKDCTDFFPDEESIQFKYRKARFIVPVYILIDKDGKIVKRWEGYSEENEKDIEETLKKIFNG